VKITRHQIKAKLFDIITISYYDIWIEAFFAPRLIVSQCDYLDSLSDRLWRKKRPGVNFINILHAVFSPISFAKDLQSQNVTGKMLMKSTPGVDFTKLVCQAKKVFILFSKKSLVEMLVKLTLGWKKL
jgi:hypothetical protein